MIPHVFRNNSKVKYLTAICEEFWNSLPVVETIGGLALGLILIPLVDSITSLAVTLRAFVLALFVSDWLIPGFQDPLKEQSVSQV